MTTIEEYLSNLSESQKKEFHRIRKIVKQIVPDAEETISYGMPTFKYNKRPLLYFGAFKNHMSLFPASGSVVSAMGEKLAKFHTSKGTLKFTQDNPISDDLVKEIVQIRLREIAKA